MRVLIADDSPVYCAAIYRILRDNGFDPLVANDGEEAWTYLQQKDAPRIVIADWIMPGMDGPDLCRLVRRLKPSPYTYFALLTSRNYRVDSASAARAGVDDYLTKPCDESALLLRVNAGKRILDLEASIARAHQYSRALMNESPFPIACLDEKGTVIDCNNAFARVLDYNSTSDLIGQNVGACAFWNLTDYRALLQQITMSEPFQAVPVHLRRRGGAKLSVELWGKPITIDGQRLFHLSSNSASL